MTVLLILHMILYVPAYKEQTNTTCIRQDWIEECIVEDHPEELLQFSGTVGLNGQRVPLFHVPPRWYPEAITLKAMRARLL
jgi:hypothetical protein